MPRFRLLFPSGAQQLRQANQYQYQQRSKHRRERPLTALGEMAGADDTRRFGL